MSGIRLSAVHFEQLPRKDEFKNSLVKLTGLALCFEEEFEEVLEITHPNRSNVAATIYWVDKDVSRVLDALDEASSNSFRKNCFNEKHARYIQIEFAIGNIDYLERSALYLLKQLGGRSEKDICLPNWAGKKWVDIWPRSYWGQLKA